MIVTLDPTSTSPIYEQIAGSIRRSIAAGQVVGGDELPGARALAAALDVNMHTVLRAYACLRDDGIVELRQGRSARVVRGTSSETASFHQGLRSLAEQGRRLGISSSEASRILSKAFEQ